MLPCLFRHNHVSGLAFHPSFVHWPQESLIVKTKSMFRSDMGGKATHVVKKEYKQKKMEKIIFSANGNDKLRLQHMASHTLHCSKLEALS